MMKVPFSNLQAAYARMKPQIDEAVARVLSSGWYIGGPEQEAFERGFAAFSRVPFAVGCANGTDAISLALRALGVRPGDEVIVPAVSAYPTTVAVVQMGAIPVFVDVQPMTGLLAPELLEAACSPKARAIVPVHLFGAPCDLDPILEIAKRRELPVVEDCAQAHGASYRGHAVGTLSQAAAFSFYPTKNLGAFGDAGAVTVHDQAMADKVRRLGNYGQRTRYEHLEVGVNSRLDPLQAAILAARLPFLRAENERRAVIASRYQDALVGARGLELLQHTPDSVSSHHLFPVLLKDPERRAAFQSSLAAEGVETLIHYPVPMPDQPATDPAWIAGKEFPHARRFCARVVSLPIHPELSDAQVEAVIQAISHWAA